MEVQASRNKKGHSLIGKTTVSGNSALYIYNPKIFKKN